MRRIISATTARPAPMARETQASRLLVFDFGFRLRLGRRGLTSGAGAGARGGGQGSQAQGRDPSSRPHTACSGSDARRDPRGPEMNGRSPRT